MDYYQTMRNDYIHKAMYPEDPTRVDFIPKSSSNQGTLTIKPKDRCMPRFVTKIEGNAVEEGCKVYFEGIVDAQPQPKFNWYFDDQPIIPGQSGFEEAEIHNSRKMSTLILKYAREHHMGKYTVVAANQLGSAECNCDLIVRKKQFPPVFWQRLYNVGGEDPRRFVGEVEVGGWPVPEVYWYKVQEDGTEVEVTSRTHTENWNGNPNKYVPSSRVEVKQIDQIRHRILFHQVSDGDSGLYRVRAVNSLGEAECEADLHFEGSGEGDDLYLPPNWKEKKRMNWKDEDQRKKAFSGYKEPELTPEEMESMKNKSGLVPLSRITEHLASLPDYFPSGKFDNLDKLPYKPGPDERLCQSGRQGGSARFPSKFQRGKIVHRGYKTDACGRICPWWFNPSDSRARDSSDWTWKSIHPDLFVPNIPARGQSPTPTPVWETLDDIKTLIAWLRSMGCSFDQVELSSQQKNIDTASHQKNIDLSSHQRNVDMSSHHKNLNANTAKVEDQRLTTTSHVQQSFSKSSKKTFEETNTKTETSAIKSNMFKQSDEGKGKFTKTERKLEKENDKSGNLQSKDSSKSYTNIQDMHQAKTEIYKKKDNLSFPELETMNLQPPPALPPKTKIGNSPSRNMFSPTESIESYSTANSASASIRTVEFVPVKEKIKLIAAQQEELLRKEEAKSQSGSDQTKHKGVRILPPSPATVRKTSTEDELHSYDSAVKRSTPTTHFFESPTMEKMRNAYSITSESQATVQEQSYSQSIEQQQTISHQQSSQQFFSSSKTEESQSFQGQDVFKSSSNSCVIKDEEILDGSNKKYDIDQSLDQLVKHSETVNTNVNKTENLTFSENLQTVSNTKHMSSLDIAKECFSSSVKEKEFYESPAEECRRSFEEAELEAMVLEQSALSKQSSVVESSAIDTASVHSFVYQNSTENTNTNFTHQQQSQNKSESRFENSQFLKPQRSASFVKTPSTFTKPAAPPSAPGTPMSQRRRLRMNQSPKPTDNDQTQPKYREGLSHAFQPKFYRPPPEDSVTVPNFFSLMRRNSKSRLEPQNETGNNLDVNRVSGASSKAYDGDSES